MNTGRTLVPEKFFGKLVKTCALFSSPFDGERAMAARIADGMLRRHGLSWEEVLLRTPESAPAPFGSGSFTDTVARCWENRDLLNAWEQRFLASIRTMRRPLTWKQRICFDQIVAKVGGSR